MIDYHLHTPLCRHAQGGMADYIQRAIDIGLREICFLDHLTLQGDGPRSSMAIDEVGLYFQAVQHHKHGFRDRIRIKAGLEIDFDPAAMAVAAPVLERFAFDYIGGSVHFVGGKNRVSRRCAPTSDADFDAVFEQYLNLMDQLADYDGIDGICHLDVMKKFGRRPGRAFEKKIDEILSKIRYKGLSIEINTSGLSHPAAEIYPGWTLVQRCYELDIPITMGSDAHNPHEVGRYFETVLPRLGQIGFKQLAAYTGRQRYAIDIDTN